MSTLPPHFVVIGAGGLGCPALLGLAAGGARQITIVDHDCVEASNLQRQILFDVTVLGMPKAKAAAARLRARHPELSVESRCERVHPEAVPRLLASFEPQLQPTIVLECTDQPLLKFALNDACLAARVPLVIGAALAWSGQAIAVLRGGACYRCIYEQPPPPDALPTCAAAGVIGPAVGHVGALMAALGWALARRQPETAGRLTTIDLLAASVRTLSPRPRPGCPACRTPDPLAFSQPIHRSPN